MIRVSGWIHKCWKEYTVESLNWSWCSCRKSIICYTRSNYEKGCGEILKDFNLTAFYYTHMHRYMHAYMNIVKWSLEDVPPPPFKITFASNSMVGGLVDDPEHLYWDTLWNLPSNERSNGLMHFNLCIKWVRKICYCNHPLPSLSLRHVFLLGEFRI